jgi:hypothetical protein
MRILPFEIAAGTQVDSAFHYNETDFRGCGEVVIKHWQSTRRYGTFSASGFTEKGIRLLYR